MLLRHHIKQLQEHYMEVLNATAKSKRNKGKDKGKGKKTKDKEDERDNDDGAYDYKVNPAWAKPKAKDEV